MKQITDSRKPKTQKAPKLKPALRSVEEIREAIGILDAGAAMHSDDGNKPQARWDAGAYHALNWVLLGKSGLDFQLKQMKKPVERWRRENSRAATGGAK